MAQGASKPVHIPAGYYIGVEGYAKMSGLSEATVKRRCASGELETKRIGRSWFIHVDREGKKP
jgi:hypothetical protein